jgi:hypothetical protein
MIGNAAASTRFGRGSFWRYPGGSECNRILFSVCQPSLYFSHAARLLSPFTNTSWRIDFHSTISLRTSGHLAEAAQDGADAPSCRFYELHTCALPFSPRFSPGKRHRFQPGLTHVSPGGNGQQVDHGCHLKNGTHRSSSVVKSIESHRMHFAGQKHVDV